MSPRIRPEVVSDQQRESDGCAPRRDQLGLTCLQVKFMVSLLSANFPFYLLTVSLDKEASISGDKSPLGTLVLSGSLAPALGSECSPRVAG